MKKDRPNQKDEGLILQENRIGLLEEKRKMAFNILLKYN